VFPASAPATGGGPLERQPALVPRPTDPTKKGILVPPSWATIPAGEVDETQIYDTPGRADDSDGTAEVHPISTGERPLDMPGLPTDDAERRDDHDTPEALPSIDLPPPVPRRGFGRALIIIVSAVLFLGLAGGTYVVLRHLGAGSGSGRAGALEARVIPPPRADGGRALVDGRPVKPDGAAVAAAADLGRRAADARRPVPVAGGKGTLSVQAPPPAEVLIEGKRVGSVPLGKLPWPAGNFRLTVRSAQHHYQITRAITVQADRDLELKLAPKKGQLRILVRPWAVVTVDGRRLGTTPLPTIPLLEGSHQVELENSKLGVKRSMRVTVKAGKEEVVKVYLEN